MEKAKPTKRFCVTCQKFMPSTKDEEGYTCKKCGTAHSIEAGRIHTDETPLTGGGCDISITCAICGEPITQTNEFGMYCKNFCGMDEDKKAANQLRELFGGLLDDVIPQGGDL